MGKLADRLKEVTERPVRPMGFRAAAAPARAPALVLLANLDGAPEGRAKAIQDGADAVVAAAAGAGEAGFWGGVLSAGGKAEVEQLKEAGAQFVIFSSGEVSGEGLQVEDIDRVLEVEDGWPDMLLRPVERLPVTAALYRMPEGGLSIHRLLQCRRIVGLVGKPVIVELAAAIGVESLALLRDAGVMGVAVPAAAVSTFHEAIRDLPPPKRERDHMEAVLPLGGARTVAHDEEEDDEDGEDGD